MNTEPTGAPAPVTAVKPSVRSGATRDEGGTPPQQRAADFFCYRSQSPGRGDDVVARVTEEGTFSPVAPATRTVRSSPD
jgi:hypothetical protein